MGIAEGQGGESAAAARAGLDAIDEARSAALATAKRPLWLYLTMCLLAGAAFGFGLLGGALGWALFWALLVVLVALVIVDARRVRRRGRIIDERSMGWQFLWVFGISVIFAVLGSITLPAQQQAWFSLAAGVFVAGVTYGFLRWDEALMVKRLAKGDFDPYTLF